MVRLKNCNILFQPHPEPEDGTMPPPPKRLRSNEMTRLIIILPCGGRQHLDVSKESTLKVGSVNTMKNCSFKIVFRYQVQKYLYTDDCIIC